MRDLVFAIAHLLLGQLPENVRKQETAKALDHAKEWPALNKDFGTGKYLAGRWNVDDRDGVSTRLQQLIATPHLLNQGSSKWCVVAAFLYVMFKRFPLTMAKFATGLYDSGEADIHKLKIKPNSILLDFQFKGDRAEFFKAIHMHPTDWMLMAAMYDASEAGNGKFTGDMSTHAPNDEDDLEKWFKGTKLYENIEDRYPISTIFATTSDAKDLRPSDTRDAVMFVKMNFVSGDVDIPLSPYTEHATVLETPVTESGGSVAFTYWSWGRPPVQKSSNAAQFPSHYTGGIVANKHNAVSGE